MSMNENAKDIAVLKEQMAALKINDASQDKVIAGLVKWRWWVMGAATPVTAFLGFFGREIFSSIFGKG